MCVCVRWEEENGKGAGSAGGRGRGQSGWGWIVWGLVFSSEVKGLSAVVALGGGA